MGVNEIITQMKLDVSTLSLGEVAIGGLAVTILSMGIVFIVLTMLMYMIKIMTKVMVKPEKTTETITNITQETENENDSEMDNENEEVAAIIAAISAMSGLGENRIVIKNIKPIRENDWSLQGRISQIGNRI